MGFDTLSEIKRYTLAQRNGMNHEHNLGIAVEIIKVIGDKVILKGKLSDNTINEMTVTIDNLIYQIWNEKVTVMNLDNILGYSNYYFGYEKCTAPQARRYLVNEGCYSVIRVVKAGCHPFDKGNKLILKGKLDLAYQCLNMGLVDDYLKNDDYITAREYLCNDYVIQGKIFASTYDAGIREGGGSYTRDFMYGLFYRIVDYYMKTNNIKKVWYWHLYDGDATNYITK